MRRNGTNLVKRCLLLAAVLLSACGRDVIAEVGRTKLRAADLDAYRGGRGAGRDPRATLDVLVERALLAEGARQAGLDDDPVIRARIAGATREILAQAFLDRTLAGVAEEGVLRKRYGAKQEELARRHVHVAQIAFHVIGGDARSRAEAESKASQALSRLVGGEPFEKVAHDLSDDRTSAARGGDLGVIEEGQVDGRFFDQAVALGRGQQSKPFDSTFGIHLVKALEEPGLRVPAFEEVRGLLAADARREAEAKALQQVKAEVTVTIHADRLGVAGSAPSKASAGGTP